MLISLIWIVVAVLVVGFLVWLVDQIPVIAEPYKTIAKGTLVFVLVLYIIFIVIGLFGGGSMPRLPGP